MDFKSAKSVAIDFGKYKNSIIDDVAISDEGLLYLDWLRGELERSKNRPDLLQALETYLEDPTIKKALNQLLEEA